MALSAGTRIGPYEVLALLGAGGMDEVYRAPKARTASSGSTTRPGGAYRMYDVSPDGKRFLMVREVASHPASAPVSMVMVLNWFEELKASLSSQ